MNEPEYRKKYQIVTDHNDYVISTSTFTEEQYYEMFKLFLAFQFFYVLGVLKYYLYFLQMDYSIRFMDFVDELIKTVKKDREFYPLNYRLITELLDKVDPKRIGMPILHWKTEDAAFIFNFLDDYYAEIIKFTRSAYGLSFSDSEIQTLLTVQKAVMPIIGKNVPMNVELTHDFVAYFDQIKNMKSIDRRGGDFKPLRSFGGGRLLVKTLKKRTIDNLTLMRLDQHKNTDWELKSALRF